MRYAKSFALSATPVSIAQLFDVQLPVVGQVTLQAPSTNATNVQFGTKAAQPGIVVPSGTIQLDNHNIKNLYISGNPLASVIILIS